jgi:hypothetical protein
MWFAIFDMQYDREVLMTNPAHYCIGLYSKKYSYYSHFIDLCFGKWQFWRWMFYGVIMALFLNFLPMYIIEGTRSNDQFGNPSCLWVSGNVIYALVVLMVNVKIFYDTNTHTYISISL